MVFEKTNIEDRLLVLKKKSNSEGALLNEVDEILKRDAQREDGILDRLQNPGSVIGNRFIFDALETDRIFHISQIKRICIDYRLRFLDSKYFKGKLPPEAISKIKELEKVHGTDLQGFKIMAPSKLFKLEDKDDPLLFAPIGNGYFYLVHKWGNDLNPFRKLLVWPFKNLPNLALATFVFSYLISLLIPLGMFGKDLGTSEFLLLFFFTFKSIAAIIIFYGFALGKNFSPAIWNSKYYNA